METRARNAIDTLPGVTMVVRTVTALGAVYEQFKPGSLDEKGAMLLLRNKAEEDAPIRVMLNVSKKMAKRFAEEFGEDFEALKKNPDGSYQIFGNWLKIKWTKLIDVEALEAMGYNKLLWDLHDSLTEETASQFIKNAQKLLEQQYTHHEGTIDLMNQVAEGKELEFPITQEGLHRLARDDSQALTKMLYCLLNNHEYSDIVQSKGEFESRFTYDPFQKRYGILHGTMALNQAGENWKETFSILQELASLN